MRGNDETLRVAIQSKIVYVNLVPVSPSTDSDSIRRDVVVTMTMRSSVASALRLL